MSYSLNSLKWVIQGTALGAIKGDTRRLDYGSYGSCSKYLPPKMVLQDRRSGRGGMAGGFIEIIKVPSKSLRGASKGGKSGKCQGASLRLLCNL